MNAVSTVTYMTKLVRKNDKAIELLPHAQMKDWARGRYGSPLAVWLISLTRRYHLLQPHHRQTAWTSDVKSKYHIVFWKTRNQKILTNLY